MQATEDRLRRRLRRSRRPHFPLSITNLPVGRANECGTASRILDVMDEISAKASLREVARIRRLKLRESALRNAAELAADNFLDRIGGSGSRVVAGYWPIQGELDPRPLLTELGRRGARCALPAVPGRERPLEFREWAPDDPLVRGEFGTSEPPPDARVIVPELLIVPLLAFDKYGFRLGYGGGYYDRTIRSLRRDTENCLAVGFAYAGQEVDAVPHDETDERLDWVVTEICARTFA